MRQASSVREAEPADAAALLALWSSVAPATETGERATTDAARALANLAANPDERLLVVEEDDEVVAALHLQRSGISPLSVETAVHTSYLIVRPDCRRHGHAHALMEAAVTWAEEKGVDQVTAFTDGSRENNRFLARLGLTTVATVRLSGTAALRKKLAGTRPVAPRPGNRHLAEVLAARRTARRRQGSA